ncbi:MAG: DUF421 domain-containing protein [Nitriliruptorales bacterium]|nr:DUF421 domain-containing protein [Nitriliruptorales bacterium]
MAAELGMTWTEAGLTIVTATAIYAAVIVFTRVFGQRQFATSSTYDLAFVFAIGSVVGRVILVRTSLVTALLGLGVMFSLHALAGWLHHNNAWLHRVMQNPPILVVAHGEMVQDGMRRAHLSDYELFQALRQHGHASLDGLAAVILERNGRLSVIHEDAPIAPEVVEEVMGREHLVGVRETADR